MGWHLIAEATSLAERFPLELTQKEINRVTLQVKIQSTRGAIPGDRVRDTVQEIAKQK